MRQLELESTPGLVTRLIDVFLQSSAVDLETISKAVTSRDSKTVQESAHHLKGSCANLGASAVAAVCQQLESEAWYADRQQQAAQVARLED